MKKTTRSLLLTALILFCAGLLLSLVFSLIAKTSDIKVFDFNKKASTIETVSVSIDDVLAISPDSNYMKKLSKKAFSRIDISSYAGDVVLRKESEKSGLHFDKTNTNNISYSIIGDTLTIKETDPVGLLGLYISDDGFSFRGLRHIFSSGNRINASKTVTVFIPEDTVLDEIEIISSVGNVELDGVSAPEVNITSSFGKVLIKNTKDENGKFNIKGNFTDVSLENCLYTNCSVTTKFGEINAKMPLHKEQSTILDVWCGDVIVKTELPVGDYKLSLSTTIGEISHNNKSIGKKMNEAGKTASRISSNIIFGKFELLSETEDDNSSFTLEETQTQPETELFEETVTSVS